MVFRGDKLPKAYTDKEKDYIVKSLKKEAQECLLTYGIKKTTVDELVKRVNIPKGTFYLFYPSKEALFFHVINDMHDEIQAQIAVEVAGFNEKISVNGLTDLFMRYFKMVDETNLLKLLVSGELESLMRKLPDDMVAEHLKKDDFSLEQMIALIPSAQGKNSESFSGAFRGIFMTMLYKREIGEKIYEEALRLMIRGLVLELME
jgi:Transcriptional regulator